MGRRLTEPSEGSQNFRVYLEASKELELGLHIGQLAMQLQVNPAQRSPSSLR